MRRFLIAVILLVPRATAVAVPTTPQVPEEIEPVVGQRAPEPGFRRWIQKGSQDRLSLADLSGRVILLHTFAWNCSSCVRVGIPLAVDLFRNHHRDDLCVISVTTPAMLDETRKIIADSGIQHPVAMEPPFASKSPYIDMSVNPITYVFVIGRNGELVWRGDPSSKLDDCLDAVRQALAERPGRSLRPMQPELAPAARAWFAGQGDRARKAAASLARRYGKSKRERPVAIAEDAAYLLARIDSYEKQLVADLEASLASKDGEALLEAREALTRGFTTPAARSALARAATAEREDEELAGAVAIAQEWRGLLAERPPLFPIRRDAASKRFVRRIERFLKAHPDHPRATRAREWLEAFSRAKQPESRR